MNQILDLLIESNLEHNIHNIVVKKSFPKKKESNIKLFPSRIIS